MYPSNDAILLGDDLELLLPHFDDECFQLIYIDPPFNTGKAQRRRTPETLRDGDADRTGFGGRRYATRLLAESSYVDEFADYLAFLEPRLLHARRLLAPSGTFTFTSTTEKPTTANSCSMRSSAVRAF